MVSVKQEMNPPQKEVVQIEYTKEQYELMIEVRDLQISDFINALSQVRNNKPVTSLIPLLSRTIRERNELEEQRFQEKNNFLALSRAYTKCEGLTKHFIIKDMV